MDILQKIKIAGEEEKQLKNTLEKIDLLTLRWRENQDGKVTERNNLQPYIEESIAASLSLENIACTPSQVKQLLAPSAADSKRRTLAAGYNSALNALYATPQDYPLCEDTIAGLHATLFPNKPSKTEKGKTRQPGVVNFLDEKAPTLFTRNQDIPLNNEIRDLVNWTNLELQRGQQHKLVVIAAFTYEFISIHPFREGKGVLSRILSTLLLLQNGYGWAKSAPIDPTIEQHRTTYYGTLKEGQQNRYSSAENISAWILNLCDIWLQSLQTLFPKTELPSLAPAAQPPISKTTPPVQGQESIERPLVYLNPRQKRILAYIGQMQPVKVGDIVRKLSKISVNTIKKDLLYLRQQELIEIHGVLKGAMYTLKNNSLPRTKV